MNNHAFVPDAWKRGTCDAKLDDAGRVRSCGEPPAAEVHQVATPAPAKKQRKAGRR